MPRCGSIWEVKVLANFLGKNAGGFLWSLGSCCGKQRYGWKPRVAMTDVKDPQSSEYT